MDSVVSDSNVILDTWDEDLISLMYNMPKAPLDDLNASEDDIYNHYFDYNTVSAGFSIGDSDVWVDDYNTAVAGFDDA